jgi:hypothetical protein
MSRAKKFTHNGGEMWFDYKSAAKPEQLELLADFEGISLDDLLDEGLTQKKVAQRLFEAKGSVVPAEVLEHRRLRLAEQKDAPACRWCDPLGLECEGSITKHHFVPRWLMLLLENYQAYAARSRCTIPICLGRHRDLHMRSGAGKSIADCLNDRERAFAQKMLDELREQHPAVFDLIAQGDESSYEAQLIKDYLAGEFRRSRESRTVDGCLSLDSPVAAVGG